MLRSLANHDKTDKDTCHSYMDVYEELFIPIKDTVQNVLEIGILNGGSIELWSKVFPQATIYGLDSETPNFEFEGKNIIKYIYDAYNVEWINKTFENIKFDILIDDGPHSLQSMCIFASQYSKYIAPNGYLIIEDIQDINWCPYIINCLPPHLKEKAKVLDRRHIKNRYDDIMIVVHNI